jgi:nucleotide-binding universal stress UspA family protein
MLAVTEEVAMSEAARALPIVVGVDGNEHSLRALDFALDQAARTGGEIVLVHSFQAALPANPMLPVLNYDYARSQAEEVLAEAEEYARKQVEDLPRITKVLATLPTPRALVQAAEGAQMVVIGRTHLEGFERLMAGTPGVSVAARSSCPVVVVPADWRSGRDQNRIVVGIDGSARSWEATDWAFREAAYRGVPLVAVHAWHPSLAHWTEDQEYAERLAERARTAMQNTLAGWREVYPDVELTEVFDEGKPLPVLFRHSTGAALLVVGSRGHGGIPGLALGHVARGALTAADVPVAVVTHHPFRRQHLDELVTEDEAGAVAPQ